MNKNDIIDSLAGKTYTLGWDAVVAYDRQKVNHLLEQQYVSKRAAGTHFPPITWENANKTIRFENLTLASPLISFENASTEDSHASAVLEFIDGNVIEKNSSNQVVHYTRIRPGMGLALRLHVDLITGQGSVDEQGKVLINFSKGSISDLDLNLTTEIPDEVSQYFRNYLINHVIIYELGRLSFKDLNTPLTPRKFIIRTQCSPGAALLNASNYGDGAVLLFIATEYNPQGGLFPSNHYPWLIPEENSSTILIDSKIVMEHYIKPEVDKVLTTGKWKLERKNDIYSAYYLKTSYDAKFDAGPLLFVFNPDSYPYIEVWSGTYSGSIGFVTAHYENFIYSFPEVTIRQNTDTLAMDFDKNEKFYNNTASINVPCPRCAAYPDMSWNSFLLQGLIKYSLLLGLDRKSIDFQFLENSVTLTSDMAEKSASVPVKKALMYAKDKIHNYIKRKLDVFNELSFENMMVFAVDKVLFPEQNINTLESVYLPGDLVIFGNIAPSLTTVALQPLISTISVGDRLAFTTNVKDRVTYTLSPNNAGRITPDGVYYAPDSIDDGLLKVMVTATTAKGSASAYISVVTTPILISPAFVALEEDNLHSIQFNVKTLSTDRKFDKWTLSSSNSQFVGTINQNGVYTPPTSSERYPLGYTYITLTASASDGKTSNAYIMLVSRQTQPEFNVLPPFVRLRANQTQKLTAQETLDFTPNAWTHYPQRGKLTGPESDNDLYWVNYTAPDNPAGDEITIIRAIQHNKPHRAGYSVIDLNKSAPDPWELIDGVSVLKVVNEAGGGSGRLYKNNAQQVMVRVQFSGHRLDNEIPIFVPVTLENILPHLTLVDYVTGQALDWESGSDWYYSSKPNEFQRLPVGMVADNQDNSIQNTDIFTLYVSCNKNASPSKRIAVKVKLKDGTEISTAANSNAGFDSSVTLDALPEIDYTLIQNISLMSDSGIIIDNNILWEHHLNKPEAPYETRLDECQMKLTNFIISPADKQIQKFHSFSIQQNQITNWDTTQSYYIWRNQMDLVFGCLKDRIGKQCAVLGRHNDSVMDGTANIWFFGGQVELNGGPVYFSPKEKDILYRVDIPQFKNDNPDMESLVFSLVKISTPKIDEGALKPYEWKSVVHPLTLSLTDIYGNTGKLNVSWDEENYYDKPRIS